jgi:hypothetical protein
MTTPGACETGFKLLSFIYGNPFTRFEVKQAVSRSITRCEDNRVTRGGKCV